MTRAVRWLRSGTRKAANVACHIEANKLLREKVAPIATSPILSRKKKNCAIADFSIDYRTDSFDQQIPRAKFFSRDIKNHLLSKHVYNYIFVQCLYLAYFRNVSEINWLEEHDFRE